MSDLASSSRHDSSRGLGYTPRKSTHQISGLPSRDGLDFSSGYGLDFSRWDFVATETATEPAHACRAKKWRASIAHLLIRYVPQHGGPIMVDDNMSVHSGARRIGDILKHVRAGEHVETQFRNVT